MQGIAVCLLPLNDLFVPRGSRAHLTGLVQLKSISQKLLIHVVPSRARQRATPVAFLLLIG
jgi:hypothetical protein